ncbi:MAG: hypothetical protein IJW60_04960 [Clostridia bacterium]|nr:hypothetical protein [Clostridia bacterium]
MAQHEIDYEYEDLELEQKPKVIVKKKGGLLGKIVALFLGIIIGIVGGLGGVAFAGYYVATQIKIKDAADTVTNLSGLEIPLSDYLSDEYADKTLVGLFEGVAGVVTKISEGNGTLNDLNDISPFIKTFVESEGGLVELLASFGIETTTDELMDKVLVKTVVTEDYDEKYLVDYLTVKVIDMPLPTLLESLGFETSDLLTAICYGTEGVDYEIKNGKYEMLGDSKPLTLGGLLNEELDARIDNLPLDTIMGNPKDEIMRTLFYGAAHRYTQTSNGVTMNQVFYTTSDGTNFYNDNGEQLALKSVAPVTGQENTYLLTFQDGKKQVVKKLSDDGKYYAFTADETPRIIRYPKTTMGSLEGESENLINSITLESALKLNDDSHAILKSIAYDGTRKRTIKDLREQGNDLINGIALADIIPADTEDTIVMYLLYGKQDVHYSVDTQNAITPLQKRVALYDGKVYNEYGELIQNATPSGTQSYTQDGATYTLTADASLGTLPVKVVSGSTTTKHDATLYYVSQNGEKLYYAPTTIGDMQKAEVLSKLTGRLRLQDVMEVGDNKILKHLGKETIDDLPSAIDALSLDDVFGDQFHYRTNKGSYRVNANYQPIDSSGNVVENAKFLDIKNNELTVFDGEGKIIRSELDKALTGSWKYMLMERETDGSFTINHHHTVTELDSMMDYLSNNVHLASVRELKLDGMVTGLDDDTLNKIIVGEINTVEMKTVGGAQVPTLVKKEVTIKQNGVDVRADNLDGDLTDEDHVGDLNVEQLMLYIGAMLDLTNAAGVSA